MSPRSAEIRKATAFVTSVVQSQDSDSEIRWCQKPARQQGQVSPEALPNGRASDTSNTEWLRPFAHKGGEFSDV